MVHKEFKMEDNYENVGSFFVKLTKMLNNPEDYGALSVEIMCATIAVFYKRLIGNDVLYILDQDITDKEYEQYFKSILENHLKQEDLEALKKDLNIKENTK